MLRSRSLACLILAALMLLPTFPALAEHHEGSEREGEEPLPNEGYFEIGLFLGLVTEIGQKEESEEEGDHSPTDGSYGVELYYRGWEHFGAGVVFEYVGIDVNRNDATVLVVGWHPTRHWRVVAGPGIEWVNENSNNVMARLGGGYVFGIGKGWELMPEFNIDLIEHGGHTLVYGFTLAHEL